MENKYKKLGKNTLWFMIGSFGQKILAFIFVPFYTNVLSTEEYGVADLIVTIVTMLWPLFTLLIDEAVLRFLLDKEYKKENIVSVGFFVNMIGFLIVLFISPTILLFDSLKNHYLVSIIYFFSYTLYSFTSYASRGLEKVRDYSIGGIINTGCTVLSTILFLLVFKFGIEGYLFGYIVGMLVASAFLIIKTGLYRFISLRFKILIPDIKGMFQYSLPMIPNSISWWISNSLDKMFVTHFCGFAANGVYAISYKIPSLIIVISNVFINAWQISAAENYKDKQSKEFYSNIYNYFFIFNAVLVAGVIWFNKILAKILFAKDFYEAFRFVPMLLLGILFHNLAGFFGTIYTSYKKTSMLFYSTVIAAGSNILLNALLIPKWEIQGAAIATCISYFICYFVRLLNSRKLMKLETCIWREIVAICIICVQVIFCILDISHYFIYEGGLFIFIVIVFFREIIAICKLIKGYIKKKVFRRAQ